MNEPDPTSGSTDSSSDLPSCGGGPAAIDQAAQHPSAAIARPGLPLPRGVAQVRPEAPAAVLMVDLRERQVLYANEVAAQMAPRLVLPVAIDEWSAAADLRDIDGNPLDETAHPLSRVARFQPVAGQGVSAARSSALGQRREPLWVVALPLDDAPGLAGTALVVFLPVRDREQLQQRVEQAHTRSTDTRHGGAVGAGGAGSIDDPLGGSAGDPAAVPGQVELAGQDAVAVHEAAVLATGLSFTVADASDPDLALVWVNPAFTAVTGYTFEQAVGHNCRFLQGPGTDPASTARMRAALETGRSVTETLLNFRADGTAFWNQVAMSPVIDARGRVTHYVGIQTDVSGRVAADAERDRALAAEQDARAGAEAAQARAEAAQVQVAAARDRLALLGEVTRQLSEVSEPTAALARLAQLVVPVLGDFAVMAVVDDETNLVARSTAGGDARTLIGVPGRSGRPGLRDVAWWHHDPARSQALGRFAQARLDALSDRGRRRLAQLLTVEPASSSAGQDVVASFGGHLVDLGQEAVLVYAPGPVREALAELEPTSMVTLALRHHGGALGVMTLGTSAQRAPLGGDDLQLAHDIAARAGLALDRARLFRQQRDLAAGLQRSLLRLAPGAAPEQLQMAVRYVAAAEAAQVGGDFYDVFTQPGGDAVAVIGDVMGHDTQAAAVMAQLRSMVRTLGMVGDASPAQVLKNTDALMRSSGIETTATAALVRLTPADNNDQEAADSAESADGHARAKDGDGADRTSRADRDGSSGRWARVSDLRVQWSNAGHPPPVLVRLDGSVITLSAPANDLLLGVNATASRHDHDAEMAAGETLLLYTDGLVERRGQPLMEGIADLQAVVGELAGDHLDLEDLVDAVLARMLPAEPTDDVALLAVCLRPSP